MVSYLQSLLLHNVENVSSHIINLTYVQIFTILIVLLVLVVLLYLIQSLILPIFYPTIISYPWPDNVTNSTNNNTKNKNILCFAGSFNPPHNGHLVMLQYLSKHYSTIIVVIGMNPNKVYDISPNDRATLVRSMIRADNITNIRVHVVSGYIWKYVKPLGVTSFIRGIRSWDKDGIDERTLHILNTWGPIIYGPLWYPIPTIYIIGQPQYNHISSTLIRTLLSNTNTTNNNNSNYNNKKNDELTKLVPSCIVDDIIRLYAPNKKSD